MSIKIAPRPHMKIVVVSAVLGVLALPAHSQMSGANGKQFNNLVLRRALKYQPERQNALNRVVLTPPRASKAAARKTARIPAKKVVKFVVLPFVRAIELTSFAPRPNSPTVVQLAAQLAPDLKRRPQTLQLLQSCLDTTLAQMKQNDAANLLVNNVARALSYFLTTSRTVALSAPRNPAPFPSFATQEVLRRETALSLAQNPEFLGLNNAQKQQLAERLIILASYSATVWSKGADAGDANLQKQASNLARGNIRSFLGVAPENLRFTNAGLRF